MLGVEQHQRDSEDGSPDAQIHVSKQHRDAINGIAYAYNVAPPPSHMEPSFYPPPWGGPAGYGMMPFAPPPPGMMMPGMPPVGMPPVGMPGMPPVSMPPMSMPSDIPQGASVGTNMQPTPMPRSRKDTTSSMSPPALPSRERFSYTRYQLELLNAIYAHVRYPNSMQKQLIAKRVGITREQVKIWFQNRRRKDVVGKSSVKEDYLQTTAKKMVPEDVIQSVLSELMAYENDPKGKQVKAVMNRNLEDKKRKASQRSRREGSTSSPDLEDGDTNLSYASSESPASTIDADITESLFTEEYRPNSANFQPGRELPVDAPVSRPSYPFHSISAVFSDSTSGLPAPMAGQTMALPVITSVTSLAQPEIPQDYPRDVLGDNQSPALIDISPEDVSREPSPVTLTITPLTPVTTDSDTNDTIYTENPSPTYSEESRGISPTEQHHTENLTSRLDISAPPNSVVMHTHHIVPLKRPRCEDSSSEDDEEAEPPRKRQERLAESEDFSPPNTVAPPSEPIRFTPIHIAPTNSVDSEPGQEEREEDQHSNTRPPYPLPHLPMMLEPISWPPPQWAPRPMDGQPGGYQMPPRQPDTEFSHYSRDGTYSTNQPPTSTACSDIAPSSYKDFYNVPPESGYSWDLGSNNNNNNESNAKETCEKTMFNHYSLMSAEATKMPSYGYDPGVTYAPMSTGRHELFTPWMAPYPGSYCPVSSSAEISSEHLSPTEQQ